MSAIGHSQSCLAHDWFTYDGYTSGFRFLCYIFLAFWQHVSIKNKAFFISLKNFNLNPLAETRTAVYCYHVESYNNIKERENMLFNSAEFKLNIIFKNGSVEDELKMQLKNCLYSQDILCFRYKIQ